MLSPHEFATLKVVNEAPAWGPSRPSGTSVCDYGISGFWAAAPSRHAARPFIPASRCANSLI